MDRYNVNTMLTEINKYKNKISNVQRLREYNENNKKYSEDKRRDELIFSLKKLKPRITDLINVANACRSAGFLSHNMSLFSKESDYFFGYHNRDSFGFIPYIFGGIYIDNEQQIDYWKITSIGFVVDVVEWSHVEIFKTDGENSCYCCNRFKQDGENYNQTINLNHIQKFLDKFYDFEKSFYEYVDKHLKENSNRLNDEKVGV